MSGRRAGNLAAAAAVVVWGLGNVLIKRVPLPGLALAANRLWLAAALYAAVLLVRGQRPTVALLRASWKPGVAFGANMATGFCALKLTRVADASIIPALQPALIMLVAGRLFGERIRLSAVLGSIVAFAGVAVCLFASASGGGNVAGDVLAGASLFAWAAYFVTAKQARANLGTLELQLGISVAAAVVVTPFAVAFDGSDVLLRQPSSLLWCLAVVLGPGSGHLIMNWAHAHTEVSVASMLTLGLPVVAALGAAVALGEHLIPLQLAGMAVTLVSLGAVVVARTRADARAAGHEVASTELLAAAAGDLAVPLDPTEAGRRR